MTSRTLPRPAHRLLALWVALIALVVLLPMSSAHAQSSSLRSRRIVERHGQCNSGSAKWDLKAKRVSGGRIYVEFEVESISR